MVSLDGFWGKTILPLASLTIAGLTGLNSFFRWEKNWQGYRKTQYTLEYFLTIWELKIVEARNHKDREKRIEMAIEATEELLKKTYSITSSETKEFFERVQPLETKPKQ